MTSLELLAFVGTLVKAYRVANDRADLISQCYSSLHSESKYLNMAICTYKYQVQGLSKSKFVAVSCKSRTFSLFKRAFNPFHFHGDTAAPTNLTTHTKDTLVRLVMDIPNSQ